MKRLLLLFVWPALAAASAHGQCCPYMGSVSIDPANPSSTDEVSIITEVTTPNIGSLIYSSATVDGDTIFVEACYWEGMLTMPFTIADTIGIGQLPEGDYTIVFTAYNSSSAEECIVTDQQELTETFAVGETSGVGEPEKTLDLFPNPVTDLLHIASDLPVNWRLLGTDGKLLSEGKETTIDFLGRSAGIYFIEVNNKLLKLQKL